MNTEVNVTIILPAHIHFYPIVCKCSKDKRLQEIITDFIDFWKLGRYGQNWRFLKGEVGLDSEKTFEEIGLIEGDTLEMILIGTEV